jgi:hypothetical protein
MDLCDFDVIRRIPCEEGKNPKAFMLREPGEEAKFASKTV